MEFKQAVVTQNGRALMAKLLAGKSTQFTKIKVSSTIYPDAQLANLTALTNIKQETTAQAYGNNTATVSVVGAIENTGLQTGYYINTVGLYAMDPDKGEILYSVSSASVNGYMPPDTGVSKSGFEFKIYSEVGNATQVDLTVDPAAFATHSDLKILNDYVDSIVIWGNTRLPSGQTSFDLNNFTKEGRYYLQNTKLDNAPIAGYALLEVGNADNGWRIVQTIQHDSSNLVYRRIRTKSSGSPEPEWSPWYCTALVESTLQKAWTSLGRNSSDPVDFNELTDTGRYYIMHTSPSNRPSAYAGYHFLTVENVNSGWRIRQVLTRDQQPWQVERFRTSDASTGVKTWTDWSKDLQTQINELKALITTN